MAQLALAGIGAAVGSQFGSASIGWSAGSLIGGLLFGGGDDTVTEGPRLGDLTVQSSAYGAPIPLVYGTARVAGNVIWSAGIEEEKTTQEETAGKGGLGGPTATTISYQYYASFAIGLAEGPIDDVLRIWADGKLIYRKHTLGSPIGSPLGLDLELKEGLEFRFYSGTETQLADTLIEDDVGAANAVPYRGLCYIVFERLPLADFGNRIPNISVELVNDAEIANVAVNGIVNEDTEVGGVSSTSLAVDWDRGYIYSSRSSPVGTTGIRRWRISDMQEDRWQTFTNILPSTGSRMDNLYAIGPDGHIIGNYSGSVQTAIAVIDHETLTEIARFGDSNSINENNPNRFVALGAACVLTVYNNTEAEHYLITSSRTTADSIGVLSYPDLSYVWDNDTAGLAIGNTQMAGVACGLQGEGQSEAWFISSPNSSLSSTPLDVIRIRVNAGAKYTVLSGQNFFYGVEFELVDQIVIGDFPGHTDFFRAAGVAYDPSDNGLLFAVEVDGGTEYIAKWTEADRIVWRNAVNLSVGDGTMNAWAQSRVRDRRFGWMATTEGYVVNTDDGSYEVFDHDFASSESANSFGTQAYDGYTNASVGLHNLGANQTGSWYFGRVTAGGTTVAAIVSDVSERAGLISTDYDVTDLADDPIPGYIVSRNMRARAAIEPLAATYFFDGVESDYIFKYPQRPKAVVRTITQEDLGLLDAQEFLREQRVQDLELPARVTISFMDQALDYEQGSQYARRMLSPDPSMRSRNSNHVNIPAVWDSTFAKRTAEKLLYQAWIERVNVEYRLSWRHVDLDPGDSVTVTLDNGVSLTHRLQSTDMDVGLRVDIGALSEDANQYDSTVEGDSGLGNPVDIVAGASPTRLIVMDSPLLRDRDEPAGRAFNPLYVFAGGYSPHWLSATVWKSSDDVVYAPVLRVVSGMSWGQTTQVLGDPSPTVWQTDEDNEIRVVMLAGDSVLASVTQAQMLDGANPAAIIKTNGEIEVVQYRDASQNTDGTWSLTGLLRGRRGTDTMATGHTSGELFVVLSAVTGQVLPIELSEVDALRYFKAVSQGQIIEEALARELTPEGRALMPYAPVHVAAIVGGSPQDITITWVRRTRVGGDGLPDGVGEVPLSEDSESYEIDIYDTAGSPSLNLVRTLTATSEAVEYKEADVITDFGAIPATLTLAVYQMSAQVGRGFAYTVTVNVE